MSLFSRSLRIVAAALMAVGLLARPASAVMDCPMGAPSAAAVAHGEHADDEYADDEHAGHHESPVGDDSAPASEHESCPDLAHCAVAVPAAVSGLVEPSVTVKAPRVVTAHDRPTSPISSLEPPPPKRN